MILQMVMTTGSETCSTMNSDQTNKTANDAKVSIGGKPCWAARFGLPL